MGFFTRSKFILSAHEVARPLVRGSLDPAFVLTVRKKLGLDQREAGEIFGGGVNAFSRYENGKAQPHPSTVKLLKLLNLHPELLEQIRN